MFAYLRHISIISLFCVLAATFSFGMYFTSVAADSLTRETETNNMALVDFFAQKVWFPNKSVFEHLQDTDIRAWYDDASFKEFAQQATYFMQDMPAIKVNLYTPGKKRFLTSNPTVVKFGESTRNNFFSYGRSTKNEDGNATPTQTIGFVKEIDFNNVLHGATFGQILTNSKIIKDGTTTAATVIQLLIPIVDKTSPQGTVQVVMEIIIDIRGQWDRLTHFQLFGTSGIFLIFVMLFGALFYTTARAERIIERQIEANAELAAAKSKAEAENIEKSKFLANVSHELRTPLNAIIGFSAIIKDEVSGPIGSPLYKDYITDIHTSGSHLLSLINDILDYSKAEADKLQMESVDVDITKTVKTCIRLVLPRAEEAKVQLKEGLPKEHLVLKSDPKRLKQVLLNLLSNSVKFTPEGGSVTLSAAVEGNELVLTVSDTGIGIADKDISKAMATFGQVDSTISRKYEGTGLGLPLTKKLTELMGGKFRIQSELGFGTTVTISFPFPRKVEANAGE